MKILFVIYIRGFAGAEKFVAEVLSQLKEKGFEVALTCIHLESDGLNYQDVTCLIDTEKIPIHYIQIKNAFSFKVIKDLAAIIKAGNFDVVHSNMIHADFWASMVKRLYVKNITLVSTKHGYDNAYANKFGLYPGHRIYNLYYFISLFSEKNITRSSTISEGVYKLWIDLGICSPTKTEVIHYGFQLQSIEKQPVSSDVRFGNKQICIVGRLIDWKGHEFVIRALPSVIKHLADVKLIIVGSGEHESYLKNLVNSLYLNNYVIFEGFKRNALAYMSQSDVVIVPSISEGFGIVTVEAFVSKTPVIAFDVPACNELIEDGHSGFLIPPYDIDKLTEKIVYVLQNKTEMKTITDNAYHRLTTVFSSEKMIEKLLRFYEKALNKA